MPPSIAADGLLTADAVVRRVHALLPGAKDLLLAVSGGSDSVALLRLLHEADAFSLHVGHVDHMLRPSSAADAAFVRELSASLALPFVATRVPVAEVARQRGWNIEDAARRLRYDFLTRAAKAQGCEAIVTAHTLDDQAETVLLQLLRGAAYLRGMPARRGQLIRPLLAASRAELRAFLAIRGQSFCEDESNADTSRERAWLRHEVLPLLQSRRPSIGSILGRTAQVQGDIAGVLEPQAARLLGPSGILLEPLQQAPAALQRSALAQLLKSEGVAVDLALLETLRDHLWANRPTYVSLGKGKQAKVSYGKVAVVPKVSAAAPTPQPRTMPGNLDPAKLAAFKRLHYRHRLPGDYIYLRGGRKKVKELLIDQKIPREVRDGLWVLAQGDAPGEVLWIEGVAADVRVAKVVQRPEALWMEEALELARQAAAAGEVPIGAVVVQGERVLGRGCNRTKEQQDPTAHAEVLALREAAKALGDWRLTGCTLVVSLEPCPMCAGALLAAHVTKVIYGASNTRDGALGTVADIREHAWKRNIEVVGGVRAKEAQALLSSFFSDLRAKRQAQP